MSRPSSLWVAAAQAGALCLVAGYVDALGYIQHGGVFAANMTGNTVLLAISGAKQDWARASTYAMTLGAFLVGGFVSEILIRAWRRVAISLLLSAVPLVAIYTIDPEAHIALALLAVGMGLQGAAVARFDGANLQTVVITGTLLKLTEACGDRIAPGPPRPNESPPQRFLPLFFIAWITYGLGAVASYEAMSTVGRAMILLPIALIVPVAASLFGKR